MSGSMIKEDAPHPSHPTGHSLINSVPVSDVGGDLHANKMRQPNATLLIS